MTKVLLALALIGWPLLQGFGAEAGIWKAGLAKTVITPSEPIWMAGFGIRTQPSKGVRQDIYARALALEDDAGKRALLLTLDLVSIDAATAEAIAQAAQKRFGLSRDRLMINVSHTHSGPVAGLTIMPMYDDLPPSQLATVHRYTDQLVEKALATMGQAIEHLQPASLSFGQGLAGIAVNRRRVADRSRPGTIDPDVPVLAIRTPTGTLTGIIVGYATHATALNDYLISGDWPGFALEQIERNHPGSTALFIQGCGADANPLPRRDEALARVHASALAAAVDQVLASPLAHLASPLETALTYVDLPFQPIPPRREWEERSQKDDKYIRLHARRLLQEEARDGSLPAAYAYPVQAWRFGPNLTLIALGGEVVADYSLRLKKTLGFTTTWVAGYSNDVMAYIPSERVLAEGGYEAGDSMIYFGRPGPFQTGVEDLILKQVDTTLAQLSGAKK